MPPLFEDLPLSPCPHPPQRLYSGVVRDPMTGKDGRWVSCCGCGQLLVSGYSQATLDAVGGRRAD